MNVQSITAHPETCTSPPGRRTFHAHNDLRHSLWPVLTVSSHRKRLEPGSSRQAHALNTLGPPWLSRNNKVLLSLKAILLSVHPPATRLGRTNSAVAAIWLQRPNRASDNHFPVFDVHHVSGIRIPAEQSPVSTACNLPQAGIGSSAPAAPRTVNQQSTLAKTPSLRWYGSPAHCVTPTSISHSNPFQVDPACDPQAPVPLCRFCRLVQSSV